MGLPIHKIIIATNSNDILSNFFKNGIYKISNVIPTISPSMDIQVASNFERLLYEILDNNSILVRQYMDELSNHGSFTVSNDKLIKLNKTFVGLGVNDQCTSDRIKFTYSNNGLVIDPHTAVGLEAAHSCKEILNGPCIVLSTAHPVKFSDAVSAAININSELPKRYKSIFSLEENYNSLPSNVEAIKNFIASKSNV
jgi:threonine synthase